MLPEPSNRDAVLRRLRDPDAPWFEIGRSSAKPYLARKQWLFRRVETLDFQSYRSARRTVSVDFEIPWREKLPDLGGRAPDEGVLAPISVFRKWPPLIDFSMTGQYGHPASLYTRDTNKQLDFGVLIGVIETLIDSPDGRTGRLPLELEQALAVMVASDQPNDAGIARVVNSLTDELNATVPHEGDSTPRHIASTVDLAAQLSRRSILWVPVVGRPGTDCIVKFSYLDEVAPDQAWWKALVTSCSWRGRTIGVPLQHAGRHTRYHLDIHTPSDGVSFIAARVFAFPGASVAPISSDHEAEMPAGTPGLAPSGDPSQAAPAASTTAPATPVSAEPSGAPSGEIPAGESQIVDGRVHIYLPFRAMRSHRVVLELGVAATRGGFIERCVIATAAIVVLMSVTFAKLTVAAEHIDATVVLLAAVPAIIGIVIVRANEHALEREHIAGVRAMALWAGSMPILGSIALLLTPRSTANAVWAGLLLASWYLLAGVCTSWVFAAPPRRLRGARRWRRMTATSGAVFAGSVLASSLLVYQPYSEASRNSLVVYLIQHRALVLSGVGLLGVGFLALYTFVGGVWRMVGIPRSAGRAWWNGMLLIVGAGLLCIWCVSAGLTLDAWQTLALSSSSDGPHVVTVSRVADAMMNAALFPGLVFMIASSIWLIRHSERKPRGHDIDLRLVVTGLVCGLLLVAWRVLVLFSSDIGASAPQVAWVGFAVWVSLVSTAFRDPKPAPSGQAAGNSNSPESP